MKLTSLVMFIIIATSTALFAQEPPSDTKHGIMVRAANIYINPDSNSAKIGEVDRGKEVFVLDQSREWLHVMAILSEEKNLTGWILDKGVVRINTPDGDKILFGEAAASELQASERNGRKGAADDARRLYYRVFDYFPKSPLAGEALYRAADILWQIESADVRSRPSAKERNPILRQGMDEQYMKMVEKKFPGTKWADMAAFHLIENKLCGDWMGEVKCPEKEAEMYEKYANERPNSPRAAEALYDAAKRRAALVELYKTDNNEKGVEQSKNRLKDDCQLTISKYPQTDWAYRATALVYMVDQGIHTYSTEVQ